MRIQMPEEFDDLLKREAARQDRSKGSLPRGSVRVRPEPAPTPHGDPLTALIGTVDIQLEDVDEVVYGR